MYHLLHILILHKEAAVPVCPCCHDQKNNGSCPKDIPVCAFSDIYSKLLFLCSAAKADQRACPLPEPNDNHTECKSHISYDGKCRDPVYPNLPHNHEIIGKHGNPCGYLPYKFRASI